MSHQSHDIGYGTNENIHVPIGLHIVMHTYMYLMVAYAYSLMYIASKQAIKLLVLYS
jgi:hypothetical protein